MNGILLVNKSKGITSFDAVRNVRRKFNVKKVGHAGTLDPFAEGLLVMGIGEGTKTLNYLSKEDKVYIVGIILGSVSDTHDLDGNIVHKSNRKPSLVEIKKALEVFIGKISQRPPKYSAIKIGGKRACDLVREGKEIKIEEKEVEVFSVEILEYSYPNLKLKIHSGSGFYVRSLVRDLGEILKTGAYCKTLFREKIGRFSIKNISEEIVPISPEHFSFPSVHVDDKQENDLKMGRKIKFDGENCAIVSVFNGKKIVCIASLNNGFLKPKKVFNI